MSQFNVVLKKNDHATCSPFGSHEISVLIQLTSGTPTMSKLTGVPPQPNAPPDCVCLTNQSHMGTILKSRTCCNAGFNGKSKLTLREVVFHKRQSALHSTSSVMSQRRRRVKFNKVFPAGSGELCGPFMRVTHEMTKHLVLSTEGHRQSRCVPVLVRFFHFEFQSTDQNSLVVRACVCGVRCGLRGVSCVLSVSCTWCVRCVVACRVAVSCLCAAWCVACGMVCDVLLSLFYSFLCSRCCSHLVTSPNLGGCSTGRNERKRRMFRNKSFQNRCDGTNFQQRRVHPVMLTPAVLATSWLARENCSNLFRWRGDLFTSSTSHPRIGKKSWVC